MDRIAERHRLCALLGPAHGARHDINAFRLHGCDGARPFHQRGTHLDFQRLGDALQNLAVVPDHLPILVASAWHVA